MKKINRNNLFHVKADIYNQEMVDNLIKALNSNVNWVITDDSVEIKEIKKRTPVRFRVSNPTIKA